MVIVIGFKEHTWNAKPHLVYLGTDNSEAENAIAKSKGFVKLGRVVHPHLLTVSSPGSFKIVQEPDKTKPATDSQPPEQSPASPETAEQS